VAAQITHNGTPAGPIARRGARRCALMLARHSPRCPPL
jgi:hypothetical protein